MLPVLNSEQIRSADRSTIDKKGITSADLMEHAAGQCAEHILRTYHLDPAMADQEPAFIVFAGSGNNGGDGLVIARLLFQAGRKVRVHRIRGNGKASDDNRLNWDRAVELGVPCFELEPHSIKGVELADNEVIIDALFGTGLRSAIAGPLGEVIEFLNGSGRPIIAIDLPSGLFAEDNTTNDHNRIIQASETLTFEVPKLALMLPENAPYAGTVRVLPIGLDSEFISSLLTPYHVTEPSDARSMIRERPLAGHKGTFGHAGLVAGSIGKYGAAVLCAEAALRSGTGLVTVHTTSMGYPILQAAVPEAMCSVDAASDTLSGCPQGTNWSAVGIGPGIGVSQGARKAVKDLLTTFNGPVVLDADALNILAEEPTWVELMAQRAVLTPHPGEFDRLWGSPAASGFERLGRAREYARRNGCIVVLKGAWTAVIDLDGSVHFNPTGNNGMAKGGSGDALTGLLTGLLAQGLQALQASILAVYLHGVAGDLCAERRSKEGMTAGDLIGYIPEAWRQLHQGS